MEDSLVQIWIAVARACVSSFLVTRYSRSSGVARPTSEVDLNNCTRGSALAASMMAVRSSGLRRLHQGTVTPGAATFSARLAATFAVVSSFLSDPALELN